MGELLRFVNVKMMLDQVIDAGASGMGSPAF